MSKYTIFLGALVLSILWTGCQSEQAEPLWQLQSEIQLGEFSPIGIAYLDSTIWLSDGDRNQLGNWSQQGEMIDLITGFDRPMHIAAFDGHIYVPEYGSDSIRIVSAGTIDGSLELTDSLDAPAGIHYDQEGIAIADFYNHRILVKASSSGEWQSFGSEGNGIGEFYYPTDVQIKDGLLYVADAYNNRVQILDFSGNTKLAFGKEHGINAATGLFVADQQIFVTDFENDRILIFDHDGILEQELSEIEKPTDIIMIGDKLYVASYADKKLKVYQRV